MLNPFERPPTPLVRQPPAPPPTGHVLDHFFKGVCICPRSCCTVKVVEADGGTSKRGGVEKIKCVCPGCDPAACGAQAPVLIH